VDGHYLIDFKLCSELAEQIGSITGYSPPPVSSEIRQDVLEYVEYNLQSSLAVEASCTAVVHSPGLVWKKQQMSSQREIKKSLGGLWPPHQGKMDLIQRHDGQMVQKRGDTGDGTVGWHEDMTWRREEKMVRQLEEMTRRIEEEMARLHEATTRWHEDTTRWREDTTRWREDSTRWHEGSTRWHEDTTRWREDMTRWDEDNARRGKEDLERLPEEDIRTEPTQPRRKGLLSMLFGSKAAKK
jgi:hypothetical protein